MSLAEMPVIAQLRDPQRYHILGEHGRGGLGRVARAHDVELGRDIAIKELISRGPVSELRFLREALITARLEHPGIVPVYEAGRWPDGTPFYAMRLVAGRPLRDLIAERLTIDERIGLLHHVIAVTDAIAYAHGRNIIHRDLKPSNVVVGDYGETVVIDWGLAKELSATEESAVGTAPSAPSDDGLTSAGTVLGTPAYMAPEQARGEPVDQRADVFAIGAMLWELCTLEKLPAAFTGQRRRILRRAGIDQDLVTIIVKALDPDPERRYLDAGALAADLKAFKAGARIAARRYSPWARLAHWARRHRAAAATIACGAVLAFGGGWFYIRDVGAERDRAELARSAAQDAKAAAAAAVAEKRVADARAAEAALEQGRAALLHHEPEAQARLTDAYKREPSPTTAFMLARAIQPRLEEEVQFPSTFGRMLCAEFSPDGTQIVTTDDRAAQIWNSRTHQLLATLQHDGSQVYHAVYSADGRMLVTAAQWTVKIWDPLRGTLVRELRARRQIGGAGYSQAAISPDGRFVAAIDSVGWLVRVWSAATGDLLAELHQHAAEWADLAFGSGGWLATTGGAEGAVYDVRTWAQVLRLPGPVRKVAFDLRSRLVTGSGSGDVVLWNVPSGERITQLRKSGEPVDAVAFSRDGQLVAAGSEDGATQVWHAGSGVPLSQVNPRHSKVQSVEFDATARLLLTAHTDGTVVVSDVIQGLPVTVLEGAQRVVRVAHFDPGAKRVVGASWDGAARLWNAGSPYHRWSSAPFPENCLIVTTSEPQSRYIAVSCADFPVRVWDTARDQLLAELPSMGRRVDGVSTAAFPVVSADGALAATARGHTVEVYDLPGGRLRRTVTHSATVNAVAFAPTGRDVISGAVDGSLLISREDGTERALPAAAAVDAVALLPDGRAVVSDAQRHLRIYGPGGAVLADLELPVRMMSLRPDDTGMLAVPSFIAGAARAMLIDLESYRAIELAGHLGKVFSARWIKGHRILTAAMDGTARMWDGITGRQLAVYRGGPRYLGDATLFNDSIVIAGGGDGFLRFWDASTGARLWTMQAHKSAVIGVHVENGDIITRGYTGEISRWHLPPAEEVIEACRRRPNCANVAE